MGVLFIFTGFLFTDIEEEGIQDRLLSTGAERGRKNMLSKELHREIKNKEEELVYVQNNCFIVLPLRLMTGSQTTSMYMMDQKRKEKQRGGVTYG